MKRKCQRRRGSARKNFGEEDRFALLKTDFRGEKRQLITKESFSNEEDLAKADGVDLMQLKLALQQGSNLLESPVDQPLELD